MKKLLTVLTCVMLMVVMASCSNNKDSEADGPSTVDTDTLDVTITLPHSFVTNETDITQEDLDELCKSTEFGSMKLNEDGTIDISMTKTVHLTLLEGVEQSITNNLKEVMASENTEIDRIEAHNYYSEFDVYVSGKEVNMYDAFTSSLFVSMGYIYNIYNGTPVNLITVRYLDLEGNLIEEYVQEGTYEDLMNELEG